MAVMIHAGRRIDAAGAKIARFPLSNVEKVKQRIEELLRRETPSAVVSSAACGADLLTLEAARTMGIERIVLLPSSPEKFRLSSVVDRPGDWGEMFDRLVREVEIEVLSVPANDAGYKEANLKLIERAESVAAKQNRLVRAMVVWDGKPRGSDDISGHFLSQAKLRKMMVLEISTL